MIVASSGMLAGGPSLVRRAPGAEEEALIAITGYQDEEAPGRRLQQVASGAPPTAELAAVSERLAQLTGFSIDAGFSSERGQVSAPGSL